MLVTVVETREFVARAAAVMTDAERRDIVLKLAEDPGRGVSLGGGLRKARIARPGSGKSGGYRVVFYFADEDFPLFLLTVFAKNEKANLSRRETADLVKLAGRLRTAYRGEER